MIEIGHPVSRIFSGSPSSFEAAELAERQPEGIRQRFTEIPIDELEVRGLCLVDRRDGSTWASRAGEPPHGWNPKVHRFTVENGTPRLLWPAAELGGPADVVELEAAEAVKAEKIAAQRRAGRGRTRGQGGGGTAGDVQPA